MPFFEQSDDGGTQFKFDVGLTQLNVPPPGRSRRKTWFRNQGLFWWSESADPFGEPPTQFEIVRAETETDLASVPRFMWGLVASYGRHTMPALVHDTGCEQSRLEGVDRLRSRRDTDRRLRRSVHAFAGMGPLTRWLMWAAVRLFGVPAFALVVIVMTVSTYAFLIATIWIDDVPSVATTCLGTTAVGSFVAWLVALALVCRETSGPVPAQGENRKFRSPALRSFIGATLIGAVTIPAIAPLVVVTIGTNAVLKTGDFILWRDPAPDLVSAAQEHAELGPEQVVRGAPRPELRRPRITFFSGP